ncbi:MAG: hypothetical protein L6R36_006602, partial [Xanthoria steineri]
ALFVPYCGLGIVTLDRYGAGKHQWNVTVAQVIRYAEVANVVIILYGFIVIFLKTAVLLQYQRIFVPVRNRTFYLTCILMGVNISYSVALITSSFLQCIPRRKN